MSHAPPSTIPTETNAPSSVTGGRLGVLHLDRLWERSALARRGQGIAPSALDWRRDQIVLSGLGLAVEETNEFLLREGPAFPQFEDWILKIRRGSIAPERIERINAAIRGEAPPPPQQKLIAAIANMPPVLTADDLAFWDQNGYVIVRQAISKEESADSANLLWEHLKMNPADSETWYRPMKSKGIMIQFFHHPILQRNRESRRIHKAFAQLCGTADLWMTTDRMSFNPPERPGKPFQGPRLHWDTSLAQPIPFGVQGLLYLTDTRGDQGAFSCVPGFHRKVQDWLKSLPPDADPRRQDFEKLGAIPIAANAGDLIIWHQALPHGSSPNRAERPRMVHYLTMFDATPEPEREWI